MGQKVNPISNRLGIIRGWDSNWYGGNDYGDSLLEDSKIRKYLNARLAKASVSRIVIERTLKLVTITVCTARQMCIRDRVDSDQLSFEICAIQAYKNACAKAGPVLMEPIMKLEVEMCIRDSAR